MEHKIIQEGVTFDDVLLVPERSGVLPDQAETSTRLTRNIQLNVPLVSAPMDTVTESALAIALAQEGGIGVIHRSLTPDEQAREVAKVKRSENGVINDPVTLSPQDGVSRALELMEQQNVSGFPVTADGRSRGKVVGILTRRDLKFFSGFAGGHIGDVMTSANLVTAPPDTTLEAAESILNQARVEKLLLLDP
ncbi:MAG: IMP dehydrogenase, partial [Planctomycetota bacterium]